MLLLSNFIEALADSFVKKHNPLLVSALNKLACCVITRFVNFVVLSNPTWADGSISLTSSGFLNFLSVTFLHVNVSLCMGSCVSFYLFVSKCDCCVSLGIFTLWTIWYNTACWAKINPGCKDSSACTYTHTHTHSYKVPTIKPTSVSFACIVHCN